MSLKIAAVTPETCPGALEKNIKSTLDAVLDAEKAGAQLVVLPKNCFLGEAGVLSRREDVSMAVFNAAISVMEKTRVCVCFAVPFFGSSVGFIYDKGELRAAKVLSGEIELGNNRINLNGEYETDGYLVKIEDEKILNICNLDYAANKSKIYRLDFDNAKAADKKTILVLPSSYPALLGGREAKLKEAAALSQVNNCAVAVCCSGSGETTSEYLRSGDKIIAQKGQILAYADFDRAAAYADAKFKQTDDNQSKTRQNRLKLPDYTPRYLPKKSEITEVLDIISRAVTGRMREAGAKKVIFGLSGGLDSAMTLMSALNAQKYGLNPADIICVTMPSRASSRRTRTNADRLIADFKVTGLNIPISDAVDRHLKQIGHAERDVVFENAQARERAQILLDLGNKFGALVLGTSDLSEAALGFSTYGGDSLAHFNPNSSLTKGAIRAIIKELAGASLNPPPFFIGDGAKKTLKSILNTPVSPELLKNQRTEDILGDYRLHEYFLLSFMACGAAGRSLVDAAAAAFKEFDAEYIQKTYNIFIKRIFPARFKTNFACDGVMLTPFDFTNKTFNSGLSPQIFELGEKI